MAKSIGWENMCASCGKPRLTYDKNEVGEICAECTIDLLREKIDNLRAELATTSASDAVNLQMALELTAERDALRAKNERLVAALKLFMHDDGCFCDAAFAGPGATVGHTPECEQATAALNEPTP